MRGGKRALGRNIRDRRANDQSLETRSAGTVCAKSPGLSTSAGLWRARSPCPAILSGGKRNVPRREKEATVRDTALPGRPPACLMSM